MADLHSTFRPEFLNRLDATILFNRLGRDAMARIVDIQIEALAGRLSEQGMAISVTDNARLWLGDHGMIRIRGTAPEKVIQQVIHNRLAEALLEGRFDDGDRIVVDLDAAEDTLTFTATESNEVSDDPTDAVQQSA